MGVERKCVKCGVWNEDNDYCTSCGEVISPLIIEDIREKKREKRRITKPTKFDHFIKKWKYSRYLVLRINYKIVYGVAVTFFAIASFFAYLAATPNG